MSDGPDADAIDDGRSGADVPVVDAPPEARESRPILERVGMAAIAAIIAVMFGGIAIAAWFGGELFLAVMGAIGCLMTAWVGGLTLFRG